jgi:hypothetical protein
MRYVMLLIFLCLFGACALETSVVVEAQQDADVLANTPEGFAAVTVPDQCADDCSMYSSDVACMVTDPAGVCRDTYATCIQQCLGSLAAAGVAGLVPEQGKPIPDAEALCRGVVVDWWFHWYAGDWYQLVELRVCTGSISRYYVWYGYPQRAITRPL